MVDQCFICLKNDDLVDNHYCFYLYDKIDDIRCDCNVKCHYRCMTERIFDMNEGIQICNICNVEYSPNYINEIEYKGLDSIKKILITIIDYLYSLFYIIRYLLFIIVFSSIFYFFIISFMKS
jgi:hypothetical protein